MRNFAIAWSLLALLCFPVFGEPESGVQITFLPPPIEGTLSLGVFAKDGKLVRALRTEASVEKDFTAGLNGLILTWDGTDDAGQPAPSGKYAVRGFAVGAMEVSGEAFHGNDWIEDDKSPRVQEILSLKALEGGRLQIRAKLADGASVALQSDGQGHFAKGNDNEPDKNESGGGVETLLKGLPEKLPNLEKPLDASLGVKGSLWVIDETAEGVAVKQYSAQHEFLRRLAIEKGEPAPQQIAADPGEERIWLLETAPGVQRVRGLALQATAEGGDTSTWQAFFTRTIRAAESFAAFAPLLQRPAFKPEERIAMKLVANPLLKEAPGSASVQVVSDEKGSLLRTADGLPLSRLTETPRLRWVAAGHDGRGKGLTVFQSDGAVVEEYRINQATNIMAFDAGEYELKR